MSPAEMLEKLDALHAAGKFHGFSIWPAGKGELQVSLATTSKTNWRIRRSDTPSEGMRMVLAMDFMDNGVSEDGREPEMIAPRDFEEAAVDPFQIEEAIGELHEELVAAEAAGVFD